MNLTEFTLSSATAGTLAWMAVMLLIDYVGVLMAVLIDLRSGTLKARRLKQPRSSRGYRRTVDKISRYFITLMALSVIDALLVVSAMLLRATVGWNIPVFPLFSTIGAVCLTLIEAKSVMENSQSRTDYTDTAQAVADLLSDKSIRSLITELKKLNGDG